LTYATFSPNLTWNPVVATSQALVVGNAYVNMDSSLTTFTLPLTANFGDEFQVQGYGSGGWVIEQNAGQSIICDEIVSTVGVTGSVASTNRYGKIKLVCLIANTVFSAEFFGGKVLVS